ncbi:TerC family protein [Gemmata sp. JC717]|uniref:TerC family protein n=1 Tax=Gemmata algarum TaxID=2975278 RepID=UPI0021BB3E1A|nr:TerC family protein [Gemmata algarum]MDY3555525.1 TerC family protein [Gemmata algarum]
MPRRPFPVFVLSTGLGLVLFLLLRPAFAGPADAEPVRADDASQFPTVRIELVSGGPPVEGKLKLSAITVRTETGSTTIAAQHVKRVTLQKDPEGDAHDAVQLTDKSTVHGRVQGEEFLVERGGAETTVKRSDLREIRVLRDEQLSLISIILGLLTLTAMEIVLGIDNVIFLAIVAGKLPEEQRPKARKIGLAAALGTRILLLFSLSFLLGLTAPLFTLPDLGFLRDMEAREVSWRDLILLAGGLFLIGKSTFEMHEKLEQAKAERSGEPEAAPVKAASFAKVILTIAIIDIVFSLDSVITAVGMVDTLWVMITAMVLAMLVMLYFAGPISNFVEKHPTLKVLALSFLILIGVMLVAEGLGQHIDKGYIYAAMSFALIVEMVNMRLRGPKEDHATDEAAAVPAVK